MILTGSRSSRLMAGASPHRPRTHLQAARQPRCTQQSLAKPRADGVHRDGDAGTEREVCAVRTNEDESICRAVAACANESPNDAGVSAGCFEAVSPYADQYPECGSCSPEIGSPETVCAACEAAIVAALASCPPPEPPRCDVHTSVISDIIIPSLCARADATNCAEAVYPFGDAPVPEICAWSGDAGEVSPMMTMMLSMGECGMVSMQASATLWTQLLKPDEDRCDGWRSGYEHGPQTALTTKNDLTYGDGDDAPPCAPGLVMHASLARR